MLCYVRDIKPSQRTVQVHTYMFRVQINKNMPHEDY